MTSASHIVYGPSAPKKLTRDCVMIYFSASSAYSFLRSPGIRTVRYDQEKVILSVLVQSLQAFQPEVRISSAPSLARQECEDPRSPTPTPPPFPWNKESYLVPVQRFSTRNDQVRPDKGPVSDTSVAPRVGPQYGALMQSISLLLVRRNIPCHLEDDQLVVANTRTITDVCTYPPVIHR